MTNKFKIRLIPYILSILTPYLCTIFLFRSISLLLLLPIFLTAFVLLIVSTIRLRKIELIKWKKNIIILIAFIAFIFYFISYGLQLRAADFFYFKYNEKKLTMFVSEIIKYKKIKQMTDGQRYLKQVNYTQTEKNKNYVDTTGFEKKYFLDDILNKEGVSKQQYERFRQLLIETGYIDFEVLEDGTIFFTMDGFLSHVYGIAYSETGINPEEINQLTIHRWDKISKNWYVWGT